MRDLDKRRYARRTCSIKSSFYYYVGNPEEVDINTDAPRKGKGIIVDIGRGGAYMTSNTRVPAGMPIVLNLPLKKQKMNVIGSIVRTGLVQNNPSDIARKISILSSILSTEGDSYIAVEFNEPLNESFYASFD